MSRLVLRYHNNQTTYVFYQLLLEFGDLNVCRNGLHQNQRRLLHYNSTQ